MTTETHLKAEAVKYWSNWPMGDPLHLAGDQVLDYKEMVAAVGRLLEPIPDEVLEKAGREAYALCKWPEDDPDLDAYRAVIVAWLIGGEKPQ